MRHTPVLAASSMLWAVSDPEASFCIDWWEYSKKAKRNQEAPTNGNSFTSNSERLLD